MVQQKKEVIKHFDAWSASYEQEVWSRDKHFHKLIKEMVINSIQITTEQNILELGVGTGIYLKDFFRGNHFVIGMDISAKMLKKSKEKIEKYHINVLNLVLADAEFLPFRGNTFDIINCIEVLRHLPNPYKKIWNVFKEMYRILKIQGSILATLPNILFPLNLFWVFYYFIPLKIMKRFHKGIGIHYNQKRSFPHFPVLYNEPEDHMFNIFFIRSLINRTNLKLNSLRGIFFFPACPKILFPIIKKMNKILGTSIWAALAYAFFIKLNRP
ncbi:MAG: class I SAM-dependent methyltransferase [Candidatus Helarchaeota archaeon]|nr:class I SAM-dependent methyltransferase [Candidatus Helarchaeota archaeon]